MGLSSTPIAAHGFLSDCHSAALVTDCGCVDWLCFPRFDSPSVFGGLLDDSAGHWSIHPVGRFTSSRRYLDQTLVLETTFETDGGIVTLVDALAMGPDNRGHALGKGSPHLLIRSVTCLKGEVEIEIDYEPRPEYGIVTPLLSHLEGGVTARGGAEWLVLSTPIPMTLDRCAARGRRSLRAGHTVSFALHSSTLEQLPARVWSQREIADRLASTVSAWRSWSALHQNYQGPWRDQVHASGRVLQGLTFAPSGAIIAAPTTSLPEQVGGGRNWDYRYAWVRDASLTMQALWVAACPDEASEFFAFMTTAAAGGFGADTPLQIMYGVGGEHDLTERELPHLTGWRDSRPVRVGNDAWRQPQLDVYGELLTAAENLSDQITSVDDDMRVFLVALADAAANRWQETDQGIWEVRGPPRHFVHSKVMCWAALDRAIMLAGRLHAHDKVDQWRATRDTIRQTVMREGWNPGVGAFTQCFGSAELDASALVMPIVGFLPADDPRMTATIDAIDARLTDERGLLYRYLSDGDVDGLTGPEGPFLLCTFWLSHALAAAGQVDRATQVFERALACGNDIGLFAEEVAATTGEQAGNFPQAFSHIGLINAAWAIAEAQRHQRPTANTSG